MARSVSFSATGLGADIELTGASVLGITGDADATFTSGIVLSAKVGTEIAVAGTDGALAALGFTGVGGDKTVQNTLNAVNVLNRESATEALRTLDFALQQVSGLRAELGAVQIRFESTISNLSVSTENLSAARSRIRDADFAAETAELTRSQILQQAGISVLAQANATPQSVLALLQ
jgi:flagellin